MELDHSQDDPRLRSSLLNVDVPVGLQQRLIERLRQVSQVETAESGLEAPPDGKPDEFADARADWLSASAPPATALNASQPVAEVASLVERRDGLPESGRFSRRALAWALALSLIGVAVGVFQWTRPISTDRLAQFVLSQLDRLPENDEAWTAEFAGHLSELSVLDRQLQFNVQAIGFQDRSGGLFAERCRVWKLRALHTQKLFYVFDFQRPVAVQALNQRLQALNRTSGGWSLAAMRVGEHLVVVLVEGALDSYLYVPQSA